MRTLTNRLPLLCLAITLGACSSSKSNSDDTFDAGDTGLIPDVVADTGGEDTTPDTTADVGADTSVPDTTPDADCPLTLVADMPTTIVLDRGGRVDVKVALDDCDGAPVEGELIDFAIEGEDGGSSLRNTRARTDNLGRAHVELVAGNLDATFQVRATFADTFVEFSVDVSGTPNGAIAATIDDQTEQTIADYTVLLFADRQCESVDFFEPLGAFEIIEPVTDTTDPTNFVDVPPADGYAVMVQAITAEDRVIGVGCTEAIDVTDGATTETTIVVNYIAPTFEGAYDLDNRFDLAGVLPDSVEDTLRILDELSDDEHVAGNIALDSFGVDPAAFILDFVYREICCWEAVDSDPGTAGFQASWSSCRAQATTHATGDLEQLYTEDFSVWDGAQPRITFACGALEAFNEPLQTFAQDFIETNVPDVALNLVGLIGDLSRAITDMHILSELQVGEITVEKQGNFTHRLEQMVVELRNLDGETSSYAFDLVDAGLENLEYSSTTTSEDAGVLTIPEHSFRLDFGKLLRFIFTDVLLPTLDCDRDHDGVSAPCEDAADLLGTWIDCGEVGEWLFDETDGLFAESTYTGFCNTGVDAAGLAIEAGIQNSVDAETVITLEGTVEAGEVNERRVAITLVNGVWAGQLVEDDVAYGDFPGTFTGERIGE